MSEKTPPTAEQVEKILRQHIKTSGALFGVNDAAVAVLAALAPSERASDAEEEEAYQIGLDDGRTRAVQEIDKLTGGDGEYTASTLPGRGCPDATMMIQRIVDRLNAAPAERAEAVPDQSTKEFGAMSDIPRRVQIEKLTPAENAIRLANEAVEALPADVRLTGAQILLSEARDLVADYIDGIAAPTRAGALDAAGSAATEAQYLAAIAGRSDFRVAYRRALVVVKYARVLRDKWRTHGQKIDSSDFLGAISDTCDAADQFDFGSGKIEDAALAAGGGGAK